MLGTDTREPCKEQLSLSKTSGTTVQRRGRVCSTAVNPSLERYSPCGVFFSPVSIFRKEFPCLLSPTGALLRKPEHMLKGFLYQVLQASFEHTSYPLGLVGPLMPGIPDDLIAASAANFTQKRKVNVTKSKTFRELKHNWTLPPPIKGSVLCIWSCEQLAQWDTKINGANKPPVMLFVK